MCKRLIWSIGMTWVIGCLANPVTAALVAYYPMDEGTGSVVANAEGYAWYNGTARNGDLTWVDGPPGFGKALSFDGSNPAKGWVDCGRLDVSTGQLTIAFWICWQGSNGNAQQGVVAQWDPVSSPPWGWYIEVQPIAGSISLASTDNSPPGVSLLKGQWTHLAVTFNGNTLRWYVGGVEKVSTSFVFSRWQGRVVTIGCSGPDGQRGFNGAIDEVRFYSTALSGSEIQKLMKPPPPPPLPVSFGDPALKAVVQGALVVMNPTGDDMLRLTRLEHAGGKGITDLTGLEYATNAEWLVLRDNSISSIQPLSGLTKTTYLDLAYNSVQDVTPLSKMTGLKTLNLFVNRVRDITALSGLASLEWLDLGGGNSLSGIQPLANLTNLTWLNLYNTSVADIGALSRLTRLQTLNLSYNNVTDISPLAGLTLLQYLYLTNDRIHDISPLANLRQLKFLDLRGNQLSAQGYGIIRQIIANNPGIQLQYDPFSLTPPCGVESGARFSYKPYMQTQSTNTLKVWVEGTDLAAGQVTLDGSVTGAASVAAVVWDWGDGSLQTSRFPQTHVYADNHRNYLVKATAILTDGSAGHKDLLVRFAGPTLGRVALPTGLAVTMPTQVPTLGSHAPGYVPPSQIAGLAGTCFGWVPREVLEYVLSAAAAVQTDYVNYGDLLADQSFRQVVLLDPALNKGSLYSLWFTTPASIMVPCGVVGDSAAYSSLFREMGRNVALNYPRDYCYGGKVDGPGDAIYAETIARIIEYATAYELLNNPERYGLGADLTFDIEQETVGSFMQVAEAYRRYVENVCHFSSWDDPGTSADESTDTAMTLVYKFVEYAECAGRGFTAPTKRLCEFLGCFDSQWAAQYGRNENSPTVDSFRATLMVAALSYATQIDLRAEFRELGFPISDGTFNVLTRRVLKAIQVPTGAKDLAALCNRWLVQDCSPLNRWADGADRNYDGVVDLKDLALLGQDWALEKDAGITPMAHWPLDEGSGQTAFDIAGASDGVVDGASWTTGRIGNALWFDGIDDYMDCGSDSSLNPVEMTVALWVRPESKYAPRALISKAGSGFYDVDFAVQLGMMSGLTGSFGNGSQGVTVFGAAAVANDDWTHVAFTRNGSEASLYINGSSRTSAAYSFAPGNGGYPLRIGNSRYGLAYLGKIDDVRIYDVSLNLEQIKALAAGEGQ